MIGFFLVPPVAKYYLAKNLSDLLDRQVTIRDIAVNPFALTAIVRGVSIQDRSGAEVFASFDTLALNLQARSIVHLAPILEEIRLERPYVHLVRLNDGSYNFSDLVNKFAAKSKDDPQTRSTTGPRFSFNNIQLAAARVDFDDRPKKSKQVVSDMNIAIPFISNLPYLVDRYVEPSFSGKLNGTPFGISGRTKPFEPSRETLAELNLESLDIARYVEYVPVDLGFRVTSGMLDAHVTANFVRLNEETPALILAGRMEMRNLALAQRDGRALANIGRLQLPIESIGVFARQIKFGSILIDDPEFFIRRDRDGQLNWAKAVSAQAAAPGQTEASPSAEPPAATRDDAPPPVKVQIAGVQVNKGRVHFADEAMPQPFKVDVTALNLMLHGFSLPQKNPLALEASFSTGSGEAVKQTGNLLLSPLGFDGDVELTNAKLKNYAPYYAHLFSFDVQDGAVNLSAHVRATQSSSGISGTFSELDALVTKLRLRKRGVSEDFLSLPTASIQGMELDFDKRTLQIAQLSGKDGKLSVIREKDGSINFGQLLAQPEKIQSKATPAGQSRAAAGSANAAEQNGWQWLVKKIAVERYAVSFEDRTLPQPVVHALEPIKLTLENLSGRANSTAKIALELAINKTGKVDGLRHRRYQPASRKSPSRSRRGRSGAISVVLGRDAQHPANQGRASRARHARRQVAAIGTGAHLQRRRGQQ